MAKYRFIRDDGEAITSEGHTPETAWETLCESLYDDRQQTIRFCNTEVTCNAIEKKGYTLLNDWIAESTNETYHGNKGPAFLRV